MTTRPPAKLADILLSLGLFAPDEQRQWLEEQGYSDIAEDVLALARPPAMTFAVATSYLEERLSALKPSGKFGAHGEVRFGTWTGPLGKPRAVAVKTFPNRDDNPLLKHPLEIECVEELRKAVGCPLGNLVEYLEYGYLNATNEAKGALSVVMPLADSTLEGELKKRDVLDQFLTPREAARLGLILARVLKHCHENGVIHRDLKPANILLYRVGTPPADDELQIGVWRLDNGEAYRPAIADFGAARASGPAGAVTATTGMTGTHNYMPYEQRIGGHYTHHIDHYALGVVLYECVAGQPPFDFRDPKAHDRLLPPEQLPEVETDVRRTAPATMSAACGRPIDVGFESIVRQLLRKKPIKRYVAAAELVEDLRMYLEGRPVQAPPPSAALDDEDLQDGDPTYWSNRQQERARAEAERIRKVWRTRVALAIAAALAVTAKFYYEAETARKGEVVSKTDATINLAANHERMREPGETAVLLAHALNGLNGEDPGREEMLRYGLALARSQLRPLQSVQKVNGNIRGAAVSPDGKTAVIGSTSRQVHFFDAGTGEPRRNPTTGKAIEYPTGQTEQDAVASLAFSPDGRTLAVATDNGNVHLLDAATGLATLEKPIKHSGSAMCVTFAHGGRLVVAGRKKGGPPLAIYDVATGGCVRSFDLAYDLYAAAVSPDGRWLAAGGGFPPDHGLTVWDLHKPDTPPRELPQMTRLVTLAFRPERPAELVTGDFNGGVTFWDVTKGLRDVGAAGRVGSEVETRLDGIEIRHRDAVRVVAFSEDGRYLLVGGEDGSAQLYDADSRLPIGQRFVHVDQVRAGGVSVAGARVLTTDFRGDVRFWALTPIGEPARALAHPGPIRTASFDSTGEYVLTGCNGSTAGMGGARVWKWRTSDVTNLKHNADVLAAEFRPNIHQAATGANDGTAILWDCGTGEVIQHLPKERLVYSLAFLGTNRLVYAGLGSNIRVLDAEPGGVFRPLDPPNPFEPFEHKNYSFIWKLPRGAGGRFFSDGGMRVKVWEPIGASYSGRLLKEMDEKADDKPELRLGAADRGGYLAVAADTNGNVYLLDAAPGAVTRERPLGSAPHGTGRVCADYSGENLFATAGSDGTVWLWHRDGGEAALPKMRHPSPVDVVRFSPDGRWLATGCQDGGVRLWDVRTATWTGAVWYHGGPVTNIEFNAAADHLLSAGRDGLARVVPLPKPVVGDPRDLLEAVQADTGLLTTPNKDGSTAAFAAPRPLKADELHDRLKARQRLPR